MPDIHTYYNRTRFDYRRVWNPPGGLSVHFGFYDEHAQKHPFALDNMNRALADLADLQPGESVLDAGCGMGGSCFWLAEHRKVKVTGISIVESQVLDCQRELSIRKADNIGFLHADYLHTPFADASFDVVLACESVCHTVHKSDFYREAFRLLKPGGRLVMAEYIRTNRPLAPIQEQLLAEWLHPWAIPDLDTESEHRAHAHTAGLEEIAFRDVTPNVRTSLRNLHEISTRWWPIGRLLNRLGLVDAVRLDNARASIRQWEALQTKAWWYGMMGWRKV